MQPVGELETYVLGYLVDPGGQNVVLLEKRRPSYLAGKWMGVGGRVEAGEAPVDAVRREFREEAGADIPSWTFVKVLERPERPCDLHIFFACDTLRHITTMTDEAVRIVPLSDVDQLELGIAFTEIRAELLEWVRSSSLPERVPGSQA